MKKNILAAICIAVAFVSCSKSDEGVADGGSTMMVSIEPIIATRATELYFESDDQIGLSIVMDGDNTTFVENSMMSYDGSNFTGSLAWYDDTSLLSTLTAYYPYVDGENNPTSFTIKADQTADRAYTESDLMIASKSLVMPSETSILMSFKHLLSRVVIDVDNQSEQDIESIKVSGSYGTAVVSLWDESAVVDSTSELIEINVPLWDDDLYKAIIVPQTAALTYTVVMADGTESSVTKAEVTYAAGAQYSVDVLVSAEGGIDVTLSGDIDDWVDGGVIPDAESDDSDSPSFEEFDTYFVYDGETYNIVTLSDGSVWMADNLRYLPSGYTASTDPAEYSCVWYPYEFDYAQASADDALATNLDEKYVVVNTSEEAIEKYGYLYNVRAVFGEDLNYDSFDKLEGAQGICPPGWHVPTKMEYFTLVGSSNGMTDDTNALFYETDNDIIGATKDYAHIQEANDQGFNFLTTGYVNMSTYEYATTPSTGTHQKTVVWSGNCTVSDWYGQKGLTYLMTSTPYQVLHDTTGDTSTPIKGGQMWGVMTTFSTSYYPVGRLGLSYCYASAGMAVRCVKDNTVDVEPFVQ